MKINVREKILLISVLVLLVVIGMKSVFFDAFKPSTDAEKEMVTEANQFISNRHNDIFYNSHFLSTRIIEVIKTEEDLTKVHYRKYVVFVLPFGDEYEDIEK